ncbi:hypothetical protein [Saccharopolyspora shandongensis]|uniref:hypothetical protein n=1 Tax=Saccharopolyspora shandongensis TaxID=418495 RepID=UPI0033CFA28F
MVEQIEGALDVNNDIPGEHVVRLLGIDAPEMNYRKAIGPECGAKTALNTWNPEGELEPERVRGYRMATDTAVRQHAGAHSQCATVGRG